MAQGTSALPDGAGESRGRAGGAPIGWKTAKWTRRAKKSSGVREREGGGRLSHQHPPSPPASLAEVPSRLSGGPGGSDLQDLGESGSEQRGSAQRLSGT